MSAGPRVPLTTPPPDGAPAAARARWLTRALALTDDPIITAKRWGSSPVARLVVELRSGRRITFRAARDALDGRALAQTIILDTCAAVPPYDGAQARAIGVELLRLAALEEWDAADDEAREWGEGFLRLAAPMELVADLATSGGRWAAFVALRDFRSPVGLPDGVPPAAEAPLLPCVDGRRLARVVDVGRYARWVRGGPVAWDELVALMREVGWQRPPGWQQREPGGQARVRARLFIIPAAWEYQ